LGFFGQGRSLQESVINVYYCVHDGIYYVLFFVPLTPLLNISLLLFFSAYVFSNSIYRLGGYNFLTNLDNIQVVAASASSYRKQIIIGAVVSISAGIMADKVGSLLALFICYMTGLLLSSLLILHVKRLS